MFSETLHMLRDYLLLPFFFDIAEAHSYVMDTVQEQFY